ncbi:NADH pyrophosphatase [Aureimonas sp. Leaf454]|uniref:NAD(+) diphosphatase n=1 Tax=Aureimonas sp. Leaf454 TaxID=1736381 RepID=UPI0007007139|nr:NAD(+) diphosphatase [Aureimonas sp. Leaf454]KQT44487.1 NADH pyrophosphatase [Aureimonas sp. Leaf454]
MSGGTRDLRLGFAGNRLERGGETRTAETLAAALGHSGARVFVAAEGFWLCRGDGETADPVLDVATAQALGSDLSAAVLLGHDASGAPSLAVTASAAAGEGAGLAAMGLRPLANGGALDPDIEGQLGQAEHFLNWHAKSRFCGRCGTPTVPEAAGYRRTCPGCGDTHFPRTDPVSIMLIHDGADRCILGRQPRFPEKMWSCLAGFIEPGETLEDAVRRETLEEAGIEVGTVRYLASQPWPFPGSLMIGCTALATSFEVSFDGEELEDCRWFHRDEVAAMMAGTHADGLAAPKSFAIAHHLVKAFVDGSTTV